MLTPLVVLDKERVYSMRKTNAIFGSSGTLGNFMSLRKVRPLSLE